MDKSGKNQRRYLLIPLSFAVAVAGFFCVAAVSPARAQTSNAAVQQARLFNERPTSETSAGGEQLLPPLETLTGGLSPADIDVGEQWMLKPNLPPNPFTARASLSLFYTSNVALTRRSPLEDGFVVADVGIGYNRPITQDWAFGADLQQSFFRYDRFTDFDFESTNVNVAVSHQARQLGNVLFTLQYGLSRLTSGSADSQLYFGNTFSLTATKSVRITSADHVDFNAAVGYTFADPEELERAEFRVAIGYTVRIARNFTANAVARLELYDYTDSREDLLQSIGFGARWDLTEWMFVSAAVSGTSNISTQSVFSYGALNGGVTLTAHIRF